MCGVYRAALFIRAAVHMRQRAATEDAHQSDPVFVVGGCTGAKESSHSCRRAGSAR